MTKSLSRLWLAQHCGDGESQNDFKVKKCSNKIVILNRINYKLLQMNGLTFLRVTCTSNMTVISISVYFCNTCIQTDQFEPLPTTVSHRAAAAACRHPGPDRLGAKIGSLQHNKPKRSNDNC